MANPFSYEGKTVVITGAATGMGSETVKLLVDAGADVHALDIAGVDQAVTAFHKVDLGDPSAIDGVVAELPSKIDSVMNCAGIAGGTRFTPIEVLKVNWLGLRHLTEALIGRIPAGGSVTNIASIAGSGWMNHTAELGEVMAASSFTDGLAYFEAADAELYGDGYFFSKEAVQFYTMWRSISAIKEGVRINSICPGVTDTKLMPDFREAMGDGAINMTADVGIGRLAEAQEMAPAMVFLGSEAAASYVNGVNLIIDGGFTAASATGQVDFAKYF